MKKKWIAFSLFSALALALVGCNNNNKWSFSSEEWKKAQNITGTIESTTSGKVANITLDDDYHFVDKVSTDDVLLFDKTKFDEQSESLSARSMSYDAISKYLISYTDLKVSDTKSSLSLSFTYDSVNEIGAFLHKDCTDADFIFAVDLNYLEGNNLNGSEFDVVKRYAASETSENQGGKFFFDMVISAGFIVAGLATGQPAPVISGFSSFINTMFGNFVPTGPSLADVITRLDAMAQKLDEINAKLDANQQQLMNETIRTQEKIDETQFNQMTSDMVAYSTDYIKPFDDYNRDLSDEIALSYKDYIKVGRVLTIKFYQDGTTYAPILGFVTDKTVAMSYDVTFDNFSNSVAYLDQNQQIVDEGFANAFDKDVKQAISNLQLPEGMSEDQFVSYVDATLQDLFLKEYYSNTEHHQDARTILNLTINLAKRISGRLGGSSIYSTYFKRLQLMYNFAGEVKDSYTSLIAGFKNLLDRALSIGCIACMYAGINYNELCDEVKTARKLADTYLTGSDQYDNQYSFACNKILDGGLYFAKYYLSYTDKGNHPTFHGDYALKRYVRGKRIDFENINLATTSVVNSADHTRIVLKMYLMKQNGLIDSDVDYLNYLTKAGVFADELDIYKSEKLSDQAYYLATGFTYRSLTNSDSGLSLTCTENGGDGDYFRTGSSYGYRNSHDSDKWSGASIESEFISGSTGQSVGNKRVAGYANYDEGHWYWIDDEHWAFNIDSCYAYFFMVTSK